MLILFILAKNWKQMSINSRMDEQTVKYLYNLILRSTENEHLLFNNMDESFNFNTMVNKKGRHKNTYCITPPI